jgi:hypothetical protein
MSVADELICWQTAGQVGSIPTRFGSPEPQLGPTPSTSEPASELPLDAPETELPDMPVPPVPDPLPPSDGFALPPSEPLALPLVEPLALPLVEPLALPLVEPLAPTVEPLPLELCVPEVLALIPELPEPAATEPALALPLAEAPLPLIAFPLAGALAERSPPQPTTHTPMHRAPGNNTPPTRTLIRSDDIVARSVRASFLRSLAWVPRAKGFEPKRTSPSA